MTLEVFNTTAIAYGNETNPTGITGVASTGITSFLSGFPLANLEYEDPWTMTKTSVISSSTPSITFTFGATKSLRVCGILNHDLFSAGHSNVTVSYESAPSVFTNVGTITIPSTDDDLLIAWSNSISSTKYRISLGTSMANFRIGSVFWGYRSLLERNPVDGAITQSRTTELVSEQSAGGAKHFAFTAEKRSATASISWQRTTITDVHTIRQLRKNALIGIVYPEHGDAISLATGQEVFWGYLLRRTMSPRGPGMHQTTQQARYDMLLELEGAV